MDFIASILGCGLTIPFWAAVRKNGVEITKIEYTAERKWVIFPQKNIRFGFRDWRIVVQIFVYNSYRFYLFQDIILSTCKDKPDLFANTSIFITENKNTLLFSI